MKHGRYSKSSGTERIKYNGVVVTLSMNSTRYPVEVQMISSVLVINVTMSST